MDPFDTVILKILRDGKPREFQQILSFTWVRARGGLGNRRMRWLMVQCAHTASRYDPRLRRLYERHERRKGGKSAVATVAHEMVRIIFYMLKRGEPYRGVKGGLWERKLKRMERNA